MQVRPATRADLPAILDIYNEAVLNTTASYDYEPRTIEHRAAWFDAHTKERLPIFVAVDAESRVIGWSSLSRYHDRKGYQFTVENSVYVAAPRRGQGVGALLLPPLIESAQSLGLRAIIAAIDAQNAASIRLHARFGFIEVGNFKQVGFKFGRWLDVVYMERLTASTDLAKHGGV
jgi:L-amino acid N-acyltransferase YncA